MSTVQIEATRLLDALAAQGVGVRFRQRADGSFEQLDALIEKWTGLPAARFIERPDQFWEVVQPSDQQRLRQAYQRGGPQPTQSALQFCFRHARTGQLTAVREFRPGSNTAQGVAEATEGFWLDVTAYHVLERNLEKAAWYEALSQVTAGVAHDLNNCLTGILPLSEDCLARMPQGDTLLEEMSLIKQSAQKAVRLTRLLETLLHRRPGELAYHDLNELVEETLDLLRRTVRRRVQVVSEIHPEPLAIHGDGVELRRAGLIAALAAALRIRGDGRLTMATGLQQNDSGKQACWTMRVEGPQLDETPLERLADPCCLLDAPRPGLGWGLAAARQLLRRNRARLFLPEPAAPQTTLILAFELADLD